MLEKVSVSRGLSGYSFFLLFCKRICSLPIKAEHSWKDLTIIYFFTFTLRVSHTCSSITAKKYTSLSHTR